MNNWRVLEGKTIVSINIEGCDGKYDNHGVTIETTDGHKLDIDIDGHAWATLTPSDE